MIIFAFDRDLTVDVNGGPVPLAWIKALRDAGHEVWAVGNQRLTAEAGIPGIEAMATELGRRVDQLVIRPNVTPISERIRLNVEGKLKRLAALDRIRPPRDFPLRFVIDDYPIPAPGSWIYMTPDRCVLTFRRSFEARGL